MSYLKKIYTSFILFFKQLRLYGFSIAFYSFLYNYNRFLFCFRYHVCSKKHNLILKYLSVNYSDVIKKYTINNDFIAQNMESNSTIWVCWWDGLESMPPVVKACYNSILNYAGNHPVHLITKYNVNNFFSIPEYINKKVKDGIITVTHFSDIIRAELLYKYGGIWLDATILALNNINIDNIPFFSLKTKQKTYAVSHNRWHDYSKSEINRWSGFLLAGAMRSPLFEFMKDFFYAYWEKENNLIDYLFIDYVIELAYINIPEVKKMIDNVPCSDLDKFAFEKSLNKVFSIDLLNNFSQTTFHKLTWKKKFNIYTKDNKLTLYGYILKTYLPQEDKNI